MQNTGALPEAALVEQLTSWVASQCAARASTAPVLQPLGGDAGARRYFRIKGSSENDSAVENQMDNAAEDRPDLLAVYAPPASEDSKTFVQVADFLRAQCVKAPRIEAVDYERGFLLIENLGERLYLSELNEGTVEALYGEALMTLLRLQQSPRGPVDLPPYSREKLMQEMDLFPEWFVRRLMNYQLTASEELMIKQTFDALADSALEQPACFVHRDYHSRNLIHRPYSSPGVIDFQDAVWGPFTYDLVSLLRDCYVRWPEESVRRWALTYANMAQEVGIAPPDMDAAQFLRWFDLMGLQRNIKVLGIFARLALRDGKQRYLHDLPLVMRYLLEVMDAHPPFAAFAEWFRREMLPRAREQLWYADYQCAGYSPVEG